MTVKILSLDDPLWGQLLQTLRHDVYHLPTYVALEAAKEGAKAEAIAVIEGDRLMFVPYLVRTCDIMGTDDPPTLDVVSPYGYSGLILSEAAQQTPTFVANALTAMVEVFQAKGICSAFFRQHPLLTFPYDHFQDDTGFSETGVTVSVDLTLSESKIWAHTRKGHQSTINKCKRLGLTAQMVPFAEHMETFIAIYEETMHRVSARQTYFFDRAYFEALLTLGEALHCGVVTLQGQIVATSLFFETCGIVQAHLGGTRTDYLTQSPFSLLLHHARLWAKARGNTILHLGGGVGGSNQDPLFRFKSGFSRQQHTLYTLRLIVNPDLYGRLVEQRAQALDIPTAQLLASHFFPAYRTP